LRFKNTTLRTLSWLVSAVGMVGLLGAAYGLERRRDEVVGNFVNPLQMRLMQQRHRLLGGLSLVLALFCAVIRIEPNWVTSQSSPRAIPKGITVMERIVENSFSFLGYRLDDTNVGTGDNVLLSVYWQAN